MVADGSSSSSSSSSSGGGDSGSVVIFSGDSVAAVNIAMACVFSMSSLL